MLRVDAAGMEDGAGAPALFAKAPPAQTVHPVLPGKFRTAGAGAGKRGVAAFFGTWPGDETDEDLDHMLRDLRHAEDPQA